MKRLVRNLLWSSGIVGGFCCWRYWPTPNLNRLPAMVSVPAPELAEPAAGRRVFTKARGWEQTAAEHTLWLPVDWRAEQRWPVLVEFPGNGRFDDALGDHSEGSLAECVLGYGLTEGHGCLWLCLPFLDDQQRHATRWWGDVERTARYCRDAVRDACERFGGDPARVVLMGFSRGAIACSYVGLRDDATAALWCGILTHSHSEPTFRHPAADYDDWRQRLRRLGDRPMFCSHELDVGPIRAAFAAAGVAATVTFAELPFANHSPRWAICDVPLRQQAQAWLRRCLHDGGK